MPSSEKDALHKYLTKSNIALPSYTHVADGLKWRSIITLHDNTRFYSSIHASKKQADREVVVLTLNYYGIPFTPKKTYDNHGSDSDGSDDTELDVRRRLAGVELQRKMEIEREQLQKKELERKELERKELEKKELEKKELEYRLSKKMDLKRKCKVFAFVDIENKPIIERLLTELFARYDTDDIIIYGFLYGQSTLYSKYVNFKHKNVKILPVEGKLRDSRDAADIYMILYIGHMLGKGLLDDKEIYICTSDHFGSTLCHLINGGFNGITGRQCKVVTCYEELEKHLLNGSSLSYNL